MLEIKSAEQYNEEVKLFRKNCSSVYTNCFLMGGEIEELIGKGRLFIERRPGWLFIVCDRDDYSNLYYYTDEGSNTDIFKEFTAENNDREFYVDIVTRNGRGDSITPQRLIDTSAVKKYKTYQRMQLLLKNIDFDSLEINIADGYRAVNDYSDYDELISLWKECLDEKSTPLPSEEEVAKLSGEGKMFAVVTDEGKLAAVIVLTTSAKQGLLQHIVVSPEHRRKGLAASLMLSSFVTARNFGLTMLRLWVDCENHGAISLYERVGFVNDGMDCDQLIVN